MMRLNVNLTNNAVALQDTFIPKQDPILSIYNRIEKAISMTYCNANIETFQISNNSSIHFVRTLLDLTKNPNERKV